MTGATVTLVGSYLVGVQRKYEVILNELVQDDVIGAWSNPTRKMHEAVEIVQRQFRYLIQLYNQHSAASPSHTCVAALGLIINQREAEEYMTHGARAKALVCEAQTRRHRLGKKGWRYLNLKF